MGDYGLQIVTITAKEGNKPGKLIGNYPENARIRDQHLIFMPDGIEADKKCRVQLQKVSADSRGMDLYRGTPAQDEFIERWKDNRDDTLARVKIAVNWKLEERVVETIETRPAQQRDGSSSRSTESELQWGKDLGSSVARQREKRTIPIEQEYAQSDGTISWKKVPNGKSLISGKNILLIKQRSLNRV